LVPATPTLSLPNGTYHPSDKITISTTTKNAEIRWSKDGTPLLESDTIYGAGTAENDWSYISNIESMTIPFKLLLNNQIPFVNTTTNPIKDTVSIGSGYTLELYSVARDPIFGTFSPNIHGTYFIIP
jgi:hypothetical protein